jgi:hypothetical protein
MDGGESHASGHGDTAVERDAGSSPAPRDQVDAGAPPVENPPVNNPPVDEPPVDNPPAPQPSTPPDGVSLEVGRTMFGSDYAERADVPQGGTLFSLWTKIPDPGPSYPWKRGNMNVYLLRGANWYVWCLVGNSSAESPSDARYNANSMLFIRPGDMWVGDYSYFESGGNQPDAPYRDWVWAAWQIIVSSDAFTLRQWLKFGADGPVQKAGESVITFSKVRNIMMENGWNAEDAESWQPADAVSFQVGSDHGYLTHARMEALSREPTLEELEDIARGGGQASAWGDYPFVWSDGGPYLDDVSGHGRDLALAPGATLYPGVPGPLP